MTASLRTWMLLVALAACKKAAPPVAAEAPAPEVEAAADSPKVDALIEALEADLAEARATWGASEKLSGPEGVAQELAHRVVVDQRVRQLAHPADLSEDEAKALWDRLDPIWGDIDAQNTAWLKQLVEAEGWISISGFGEQASRDAWLLVQHADRDREFQRHALTLMEPLVPDDVNAKNYAYLYDRVAVADDRPQRYGSQGSCSPEGWTPFAIEEPDTVDALRAEIGLGTMEEYRSLFDCTGERAAADAAYAEEKWSECAERYGSLAGRREGLPAVNLWYNAACCAALGEDPDQAFEFLGNALEAGWSDGDHLQSDPDLESLRADPRWAELEAP